MPGPKGLKDDGAAGYADSLARENPVTMPPGIRSCNGVWLTGPVPPAYLAAG